MLAKNMLAKEKRGRIEDTIRLCMKWSPHLVDITLPQAECFCKQAQAILHYIGNGAELAAAGRLAVWGSFLVHLAA
jgi:hypothetical protein